MVTTAMLIVAIPLALAPTTRANGGGVTVYLGYLPEVSNWGTYEATGRAYVNAGEGRAHIVVDHMISDPAIRYEVWLVRADDRDALFSIGTFEVDDTGHADVELINPRLGPAEFRFLVISAEPAHDEDPRPAARRTIAGVFPNAKARTPATGAIGFDGIWTQSPGEATEPATGGSPEGATSSASTAIRSDGANPERSGRGVAPASPPRLPVTGGNPPPPRQAQHLMAVLITVAGGVSISLMVAGARKQRAAARALGEEAARGDTR